MIRSVKGIFRDGKVELLEPAPTTEESSVIVTFPGNVVDLTTKGIHPIQAADLRARLGAFAEDWDRPDMDIYDEL